MSQDASRRTALERRFAALDGFSVLPHGRGEFQAADVAVLAADRESLNLTRRVASNLAGVFAPTLLVVEEPFEELAGVMWFGAYGLILSSASDRELADAAVLVSNRYTVVSEEIIEDERLSEGRLAFEWTLNNDTQSALNGLSRREREVLTLVGTGRNNAEIAARLWVSSNTVRSHVQRLMRKLGLRSRLCLVIFAHELGLVDMNDTVLNGGEEEPAAPAHRRA
ncbi:response regulator transcription factor [Streptomyces sp. NPDC059866]|uniref:helix-turn-helix transcriptional regulator n=1 Tax=Streptomyces sp. NPDC059866 TaxID=3346978 RepID=UPI003660F62A